jgi:hypothetical protein
MRSIATSALCLAALAFAGALAASAAEIKKAGKLNVPPNATLMVFSTDPTCQQVLSEDFSAHRRSAAADAHSVVTLTVSVSEQELKPGISLGELAPGDPQVADLIQQAGAIPPPIGDTGNLFDEAALARQLAQRTVLPHDSPGQQLTNQLLTHGEMGPPIPCDERSLPSAGCAPNPEPTRRAQPGSPDYAGDTAQYLRRGRASAPFFHHDQNIYETVIVARATLSGAPEEMTVVAVTRAGEDVREAKKRVAEEIANAVLH